MIKKNSVFLLCGILFFSCQKQVKPTDTSSLIDKKEIDAVFHKEISKVLLDHLYVVVDSTTYAKLTSDDNLKEHYAAMDLGLPNFAPINKNATTCYLRGQQHYIEILGPNNTYNEPIGKSGIGFSFTDQDEHFHLGIKPKLQASKNSLLNASETVKMPIDGSEQTWFKAFYTTSYGTSLHTWYSFYNPGFLDHLHKECHTSYSRKKFLKNVYEDHKLFHSITSLRLSCTPIDFWRIANELGHLNCKLVNKEDEVYTIKTGDVEIIIEFSEEIEYSKITQITCNLNRADNGISKLGNLVITNKNNVSVWDFNELHKNNF